MPHTRKATNWVAWQTGPPRERTEEMAEVGDNNTTETTEINKSTVPVHPPYSLYNSPKMNLPSPLSAILATRRRQDLAGVEHSREGGVNVADAAIPEVDVDSFRELEDEEASKVTTTMISEEAAEVRVVDGDLAGRITTSHSATAMRLLTSSLTGRC